MLNGLNLILLRIEESASLTRTFGRRQSRNTFGTLGESTGWCVWQVSFVSATAFVKGRSSSSMISSFTVTTSISQFSSVGSSFTQISILSSTRSWITGFLRLESSDFLEKSIVWFDLISLFERSAIFFKIPGSRGSFLWAKHLFKRVL